MRPKTLNEKHPASQKHLWHSPKTSVGKQLPVTSDRDDTQSSLRLLLRAVALINEFTLHPHTAVFEANRFTVSVNGSEFSEEITC